LEILGRIHNVHKDKLSLSATFEELGVDSLDQVEAVVSMEWRLKTEIPDAEALKIDSVRQAVEVLTK
jgi:acyl carrier protein